MNVFRLYINTIRGIISRKKAFNGPHTLTLYITNRCNKTCNICPTYSPLRQNYIPLDAKDRELPYEQIIKLINDIARLGTKTIILSGGGEPLCHKDIIKVIAYIKEKGLVCGLITNGILLDNIMAKQLINLGLDSLYLSVNDYNDIGLELVKRNLSYIKSERLSNKKPFITIITVISKDNISSISQSADFANRYSDAMRFLLLFACKGLEDLNVSREQAITFFRNLKFIKRLFLVKHNLRIFSDYLAFEFFCRPRYKKGFHEDLPCYIGWFYSIVNARGDVLPCCGDPYAGGALGNIKYNDFPAIWFSEEYNYFRKRSICLLKEQKWKEKYCYYFCGNNFYNNFVNQFLHPVAYWRKKWMLYCLKNKYEDSTF